MYTLWRSANRSNGRTSVECISEIKQVIINCHFYLLILFSVWYVHVYNYQVRYKKGDDCWTIGYRFIGHIGLIIDCSSFKRPVETWPVLIRRFCQQRWGCAGHGQLAPKLRRVVLQKVMRKFDLLPPFDKSARRTWWTGTWSSRSGPPQCWVDVAWWGGTLGKEWVEGWVETAFCCAFGFEFDCGLMAVWWNDSSWWQIIYELHSATLCCR